MLLYTMIILENVILHFYYEICNQSVIEVMCCVFFLFMSAWIINYLCACYFYTLLCQCLLFIAQGDIVNRHIHVF